MRKIFLHCCICIFGIHSAAGQNTETEFTPDTVLLPEDTRVTLKILEELRSDEAEESQVIPLEVVLDVVAGGRRVARTGAYAEGRVRRVIPAKHFGKGGLLEVEPINMQLVDGQRIRLVGDARKSSGKNRKFLAWTVAILAPGVGAVFAASAGNDSAVPFMLPFAGLGFLVKGREAVLPPETLITAVVPKDVFVQVEEQ
ncbi:MAG: hypothetical protein H6558_08140 [Lewinellaceae bacterium]|nr:hypothetical protein [Lewinellaceae bacterium]